MRAFITGINGFVGRHLNSYLLSKNFDVSGIGTASNFNGNVKYKKVDLLNFKLLKKTVEETKPDTVFHLAGISSVKKCLDDPELCNKINIEGTENLLKAIIDTKIKPKIVVAGSAEVYGIPKSIPIKETHPLNPINPYAETKKEQESICNRLKDELEIVILRLFPHIGPGQKHLFVTSDFSKQIVEIENSKEPIIKVGNLDSKRDFTDVRDVVVVYRLAAEKAVAGEFYNICTGNVKSIREVLELLLSFSKVKIRIEQDKNKMRPSDIPILSGDKSKFCNQTGWKAKIPLEKTLKDLLDYWRNKLM